MCAAAGQVFAARLHHHAQKRLGAAGTDQHPPALAQFGFDGAGGVLQQRVGFPILPGRQPHVQQHLRKQRQRRQQVGQLLRAAHTRLQHLQSADEPIARRVAVQRQQVARPLAAQQPAVAGKLFQHVTIAHLGANELHATVLQCHLHCHVGHQRADNARHGFAPGQPIGRQQVQQFVAVVQTAARVHHLQPVCIAVQCDAIVGVVGPHRAHQSLRMRGAHFVVDVQSIGRTADGQHLRTQFMEHFRRDVVRRTMRGIHHDLQAAQRQVLSEGALAKLDVPPRRIVQAPGFAQRGGIRPHGFLLQRRFHGQLPFVGQLGALRAEEFDAVVGVRVVTGADHHAQAGTLRPREIGHSWCGQRAQQYDVHTRRVETRLQCAFQHVTGDARVLADQHRRALFLAAQHAAHGMRQSQDEIWRDGRLAHRAANAIGAKVLTSHAYLSVLLCAGDCDASPAA